MKKPSLISLLVLLSNTFLFQNCQHDPNYFSDSNVIISANCNPDTVYFDNEVLPVFSPVVEMLVVIIPDQHNIM